MFCLESDLQAYSKLLHNAASWDSIGALGMQAIGTTCMYVVGMLAGAKVLSMVPEVCSWLIPGGVSSGAGSASAGVAAAAGATGVGAAVGAASTVAPVVGSVATGAATTGAAAVGGAVSGSRSSVDGGLNTMQGAVGGAMLGAGRQMAHDFSQSSVGKSLSGASSSMKDAYNRGKNKQ